MLEFINLNQINLKCVTVTVRAFPRYTTITVRAHYMHTCDLCNAVRTSVLPKAGRVRRVRSAEVTSADPTYNIYTFTTKVLTDTKNIPPRSQHLRLGYNTFRLGQNIL